jgi:hypothetical protein
MPKRNTRTIYENTPTDIPVILYDRIGSWSRAAKTGFRDLSN